MHKIHIKENSFNKELREIKKRQLDRKTVKLPKNIIETELLKLLYQGVIDIQENLARVENRLIILEKHLLEEN